MTGGARFDIYAFTQARIVAEQKMELAKYHFVTVLGSLIRNLKRSQKLFPSIKSACDKAVHLFTEGKLLRNKIEHADEYLSGEKDPKTGAFIREAQGVALDLPGDKPGTVDAISTVGDKNGHWLGGRLDVERVIAEVRVIAAAAAQIPAPVGRPRRAAPV
jgi:hypothetical protein